MDRSKAVHMKGLRKAKHTRCYIEGSRYIEKSSRESGWDECAFPYFSAGILIR